VVVRVSLGHDHTVLVHVHHWHAWCRECPWEGPLRFAEYLAEQDATGHDDEAHPDQEEEQ
jgi:hypothetical protein